MNLKKFISGLRTSGAGSSDSSDWKYVQETMYYSERFLARAAQRGELSPALEYIQGIIELTIQGKRVAKTRKQWANYICGDDGGPAGKYMGCPCPFRSTDSETTKAKKLHTALLQLESFNKAQPDATLDELVEKINKGLWNAS